MKNIAIALGIGAIFGLLDIAPMVWNKLDNFFILSAFLFWLVAGVMVAFVRIPLSMPTSLKGVLVTVLLALPVLALIFTVDRGAVTTVFVTTVVFGALMGVILGRLVKE